MRVVVRIFLGLVLTAALFLIVILLLRSQSVETYSTVTGLLAVIAAVIAAYPALRMLDIQEDALRPRPIPYFDLATRYNLAQLRVKNFGAGVAYDIRLIWKVHPKDHEGNEIKVLDHIASLLPNENVSTLVGGASETVQRLAGNSFEGEVKFKDAKGAKLSHPFAFGADARKKQLTHGDELPKTLRDLQRVPDAVTDVATSLKKIEQLLINRI